MRKYILLLAGLTFLLGTLSPGCQGNKDPETVQRIDSLLRTVDSLRTALDEVDLAECRMIDSTFRMQRPAIQLFFTDTLEREPAMVVGNYFRAMKKSLPRALGKTPEIRAHLDSSAAKITDLRHDVDKGLLPDNPKRVYLEQEQLILSELERATDVCIHSFGTVVRAWETRPQVDSILRVSAANRVKRATP